MSLHPWLTSAYIFLWGAAPWYDLGCDGGDFEGGVDYIVDNGGIDTEADYPYLAHDDKCMCATPPPCWLLVSPSRDLSHGSQAESVRQGHAAVGWGF